MTDWEQEYQKRMGEYYKSFPVPHNIPWCYGDTLLTEREEIERDRIAAKIKSQIRRERNARYKK